MDENTPRRRELRLPNYNYAQSGVYFVTLCAQDRNCLFGEINEVTICLNEYGQLAREAWWWLTRQYPYVLLDEFIVMPNHLHAILIIDSHRGGSRTAMPDGEGRSRATPTKVKPLGGLIGAYKTVSTKSINALRGTPRANVWQRNYHEHIIRNETDLQ